MQKYTNYCFCSLYALARQAMALRRRLPVQTLLVMRMTGFLLLVSCLHVAASSSSQTVTLSGKNMSLVKVLTEAKKQTGYVFFGNAALLNQARAVSLDVKNMPLEQFLALALKDQQILFTIKKTTIAFTPKAEQEQDAAALSYLFEAMPDSSRHVTGYVTDDKGDALPGASVQVKGTNLAASTNAKGYFQLTGVPPKATTLVISFVGYKNQEVPLTQRVNMQITLSSHSSELDQVQIIGYGNTTTTKRFNAGDVTIITADEIKKNPVNNVLEALQGKVPGLFIQQTTGQPNGAISLRLRTSANLASGATPPLIVVDGVTYPGSTLPVSTSSYATGTFLQGSSGLSYLNPNDIESISVLKDADATALYGTSGAYGVILITTKKAKLGAAPILSANVYTGVSVLGTTVPLMNTAQYLMLRKEAIKNDGLSITAADKDLNGTWPQDRYTDFRKEVLGSHAQTTNATVSYGGGNQTTSYMVAGNFRNNGNIQRSKGRSTDGTLRFSLNTATLNGKFNLQLTGSYNTAKSTMVPTDFSSSVVFAAPNGPALFLPDGSVNWETGSNDIADDINRMYKNTNNNLLANIALIYRPASRLTLRTDVSYNNISGHEFSGYPTTTKAPTYTNAAAESRSLVHDFTQRSFSISPYAEYGLTLFGKGDLNLKAGGRLDNRLVYASDIQGIGFASDALLTNPAVGTTITATYSETPYRSIGNYAIMKFIWDQKYILNVNARRDGSTKFGPGRKFGNFWSVAGAWLFSEENWMKRAAPFISYGKLRASTGLIGGDAVGDFAYLSTYTSTGGTYQGKTGLTTGRIANPLLAWEKNKKSEVGMELGFLKDRLYIEINAYRTVAGNQLISQPMVTVTGVSSMSVNSDATILTSGWEAFLNTTNVKTKNFTWSTRFNISIPKSKLSKRPTNTILAANYILDKPVTGVLAYKYAGVNPATGNYSFTTAKNVTDDYYTGLTEADKTELIDLAPKYYGGFQSNFQYKRFSLDASFTYTNRVGKNYLAQTGFIFGYYNINGGTMWLNRWQKQGDVTDIPKVTTQLIPGWNRQIYFQSSSGAYSDASYIRLQNVSLRYAFEPKLLKKIHLKDASVYLQGQNLLTFSHYGGLDPENLDAGTIPPMRVFTAGFNISL